MKKYLLVLYFVGTAVLLLVASQTAVAASEDTLSLSPLRTDIQIAPGESKTVKITLTNHGGRTMSLVPVQNDFVANDEDGTPDIILDPNNSAPAHGLKSFFDPIDKVTIEPESSAVVDVSISVPDGTQAGGYFGAIRFIPDRDGSSGQVNLSASLASLILLRVPGDAVEELELTDLTIHTKGKKLSSLFYMGNETIEITPRFQNKGNVQLGPFGNVSLKRWNEVVYSTDFNNKQPADMILPGGARKWGVPLQNTSKFGRYTVYATFSYGEENKTINVEESFWVIPKKTMIWAGIGFGVFIGLIIAVSSIYSFRHRRRKVKLGGRRKR